MPSGGFYSYWSGVAAQTYLSADCKHIITDRVITVRNIFVYSTEPAVDCVYGSMTAGKEFWNAAPDPLAVSDWER